MLILLDVLCLCVSLFQMFVSRWFLLLCGIIALPEHLKDFLEENGFGHALTKFVEQEVEIHQISELSNSDLQLLGIGTIGGRLRIRAAARTWTLPDSQGRASVVEVRGDGAYEAHVEQVGDGHGNAQDGLGEEEYGVEQGGVANGLGEEGYGVEQEGGANGQEQRVGGEELEVEPAHDLHLVVTKSATGKIFHSFLHGYYKFKRKVTKPNGAAYFSCTAPGCKAGMRADYSSKQNQDLEQPIPDLSSLSAVEAHVLPDGTPHPIQVIGYY